MLGFHDRKEVAYLEASFFHSSELIKKHWLTGKKSVLQQSHLCFGLGNRVLR